MKGRVIKSTGLWTTVRKIDGTLIKCRIKGVFKKGNKTSTHLIAVGDFVEFTVNQDDTGNIVRLLKRENYIIRRAVKNTNHSHIIAANVDQVVIMTSLVQPRISLGFIDRILTTSDSFRIPCVILFNKKDLYDNPLLIEQNHLAHLYRKIGYKCYLIQLNDFKIPQAVTSIFHNKLSLLTGQSGVGKSSLINLLNPKIKQKTKEISSSTKKGVHTTTATELFSLKSGGDIIDTPGIKEWGLLHIDKYEIGHFFSEIRKYMYQCKFNNCLHDQEPLCAIKSKVKSGDIAESRYKSYLSMLHNQESIK